jgi:hypothetical protein
LERRPLTNWLLATPRGVAPPCARQRSRPAIGDR